MTLEEVESKLTAIAKLPEKWRKNRAEPWELIQDLEAALGSLPMEPVPEVPADPLPAGKLSDEQLGVIGLRAANSCNHQVKFYENFARAVREAVEKECNRSMQNGLYQAIVNKLKPILGENSRELEWDILPFTLGKLIAAKRIPDAGQAKKIGEQAEEIARLTAELEACDQARKNACDDRDAARAELAKANAELERMQWRPVSVKPTRGDADEGGFVTVLRADKLTAIVQWDANGFNPDFDWRQISQALRYTKWRPFCPPPIPTAEEKERAEFEKACVQFDVSFTRDIGGNYRDSRTLVLFEVWMLSRASAESKTLTQQEERK